MTMRPASSACRTRSASNSTMEALPWAVSVRMPACAPLMLTASSPISRSAIVTSVQETSSPVESSTSNSRGSGAALIDSASSMSRSVVSPMAETTTAMLFPARRAAAMRSATRRIFSASPTDVPPYFCTRTAIYSSPLGCGITSAPPRAGFSTWKVPVRPDLSPASAIS